MVYWLISEKSQKANHEIEPTQMLLLLNEVLIYVPEVPVWPFRILRQIIIYLKEKIRGKVTSYANSIKFNAILNTYCGI